MERKFAAENESQISPRVFGTKCWTTNGREVERGRIERTVRSGKVEDFGLGMFDNETEAVKKI